MQYAVDNMTRNLTGFKHGCVKMSKIVKLNHAPVVVDLFAGAGLFSYAFQKAGFQIAQAIEIDKIAAQTYAQNIGSHIQVVDICRIHPEGKCDVIIAGPPCQGFSTLGKRQPNDPRNNLSYEVAKWASILHPRIVVIENVVSFLKSEEWCRLKRKFNKIGYQVTSFALDAKDFGVAQRRTRSFTLAYLPDIKVRQPAANSPLVTVREAWDGLSIHPNGKNHHYAPSPSEIALKRMLTIPPGGDKRDVMRTAPDLAAPSWWNVATEVTDVWGRMNWNQPCNTLRTSLQNPSKGRYIHPEQHRVISLREAARLHSIPDSWSFHGTPTQIARQIGNSVPPLLGSAVAQMVFEAINQC